MSVKEPVWDEKAALHDPLWVANRDEQVNQALASNDLKTLRRLSALPGGFGFRQSRCRAWLQMLHTDRLAGKAAINDARHPSPDTDTDETVVFTPHQDEGQVLLDTHRSFVTYPRGLSRPNKAAMQEDLQVLIVGILQRHPCLSYFQGLHDIMTVLYLTLIEDPPRRKGEKAALAERLQWTELTRAAEVVCLCRMRDAMGSGLGPLMGMLKLLRRLLAAADPQLYRMSLSISPVPTLPFFALSWILTLFSHDIDTLEPVQRIFDYLIARNPISAIYLAVAILIAKKPQMVRLATSLGTEARRDPSLLHPLFARLPPLYADTPDAPFPPLDFKHEPAPNEEPNPYSPIALSHVFAIADRLAVKFPWDGPRIRGTEVFGPGSVISTYSLEDDDDWTFANAEAAVDRDVILPGGDELDDDDDVLLSASWPDITNPLRAIPLRFPPDKLGTAFAVGIVIVGLGVALFGFRAGGREASWSKWWTVVAGNWVAKRREAGLGWGTLGYLMRSIRDLL